MFQTKVVGEVKTRILHPVKFFFNIVPFMRYVGKYSRAGKATDDNTAHAHFTLGTTGYKHTLREYIVIILAFLLQKWLRKCASVLRQTYITCLFHSK
jgi:hypothetical protein